MNLAFSPKQLTRYLIAIAFLLCLVSLLGQFTKYFLGDPLPTQLINKLNVDQEFNLPTLYSTALLFLCALLLALITVIEQKQTKQFVLHWCGLALVFVYLALDESLQIHETFNSLLQADAAERWDILNFLLVITLGSLYAKFLFKLNRRTQNLIMLSAGLFILGAIAIEIVGVKFYSSIYHQPSFGAEIITTIEEFLEMLGAALFIYSLLLHLRHRICFIHIDIKDIKKTS